MWNPESTTRLDSLTWGDDIVGAVPGVAIVVDDLEVDMVEDDSEVNRVVDFPEVDMVVESPEVGVIIPG